MTAAKVSVIASKVTVICDSDTFKSDSYQSNIDSCQSGNDIYQSDKWQTCHSDIWQSDSVAQQVRLTTIEVTSGRCQSDSDIC